MWVDLDHEASSSYKDIDDDWFEKSHLIHQCSSRQLISVFPLGEGIANVELAMQEPSSPKLPPSVSQSRGKTYRSREWGQINSGVVANKRNPVQNLSSKSSRVNLGSGQTMKTKPSNGPRGNAKTKPNSVCKSSLTGMSGPKYPNPSSIVRDSKTSSSSGAIKEEYQSVSTITSENSENKQQKLLEVSSQAVSHTNGLLSALKITLRKSCATRQASRAERDGGRQSEGCKSSSGKSSVGSSSHPGYYVKNKTLPASQNKDITPDSRNVMRAPQATTDKVKMPSMSKDSTAKNQDLISKPRGGCKTVAAAKSTHLENAKSKGLHSKVMRQDRANKQDSATTAAKVVGKVGVEKYNRLGDGKENAPSQRSNTRAGGIVQVRKVTKQIAPPKAVGKVGVEKYNRLGDGKENAMSQRAGGIVQVQKVTKQIAPPKSDRAGLIVPKDLRLPVMLSTYHHNMFWHTPHILLAEIDEN
ncbi:hypothetical protein C3L33_11654, partial [Rhododendron williamsianum]